MPFTWLGELDDRETESCVAGPCYPRGTSGRGGSAIKARSSIYDGKSEKGIFERLHSTWSRHVELYPQLPLAKILTLEESDRLTDSERRYFYSTNVDFTFCDPGGKPFFSVEYDGMGQGFSRGWTYVAHRQTSDDNREWKLNFKLGCARDAFYPLIVLSLDETRALAEGDSLSLLDGIVGSCLANRRMHDILDELVRESREELASLTGWAKEELCQDLVLQAEVAAEMEYDVMSIETSKLQLLMQGSSWGSQPLREPEGTYPRDMSDADGLKKSIADQQAAERVGTRVHIDLPNGVTLQRTVWMRNLGWNAGFMPESVTRRAAEYLAFRHAYQITARATAGT
ncbi:MAG TPA: hypothetical protein VHJ34_00935 [Actinomycetota bacterium]|nr:hypothetical protein [Actinomycetota bacterium]